MLELQGHASASHCLESGYCKLDPVGADGHIRQLEIARVIRLSVTADTCLLVNEVDLDASNDSAAWIKNAAQDTPCGLREIWSRGCRHDGHVSTAHLNSLASVRVMHDS